MEYQTKTDVKQICEQAFAFVKKVNFCERTSMLCDVKYDRIPANWPTPGECYAGYPNPSGYGTGTEDGCLAGGSMLDACVDMWEKTGNTEAGEFAGKLCEGLLRCAESAKDVGYIPRGLSPFDGQSHYPDSSRDQYTLFIYGLHRYFNSALCTAEQKARITEAAKNVAKRAVRNVTPETGYDMLNENGGKTFNSVMWEDEGKKILGNHETMRLPAIYLFAYETTKDEYFLELYRNLREYGLSRCLPMAEQGYWALYTLHQMQSSLRLCYDADPDEEWKGKILEVMNIVADYCDDVMAPKVAARLNDDERMYNLPQVPFRERDMEVHKWYHALGAVFALNLDHSDVREYFALQDMAGIVIVPGLVPGRRVRKEIIDLYLKGFCKIDIEKHERNTPVYFCCGGAKLL